MRFIPMKIKRLLVIGGYLVLATGTLAAQDLSPIASAFADIGFGARPAALGSAYTGLADDVNSIQWNPAGIAYQDAYGVGFSYIDKVGLIEYQHLAAVVPLQAGVHGVGVSVISSGDDALRELTVSAAYSRVVGPVSVGATVKYRSASFGDNTLSPDDFVVFDPDEIAEGIANQVRGDASGFGFDLGLLYRPSERIGVGIMLRDVYADVSWDSSNDNPTNPARGSYTESVPFEAIIGTAYHFTPTVVVTADYVPSFDDEVSNKIRVGGEVTLFDMVSLRAGVRQRVNDQPEDEKYTFGFGLDIPVMDNITVHAHYTYMIEEIDNTQHLSFAVRF